MSIRKNNKTRVKKLTESSRMLNEAEGEMEPHLEKMLKHLQEASYVFEKSMKASSDDTISPKESKLINSIKTVLKELYKAVHEGGE
jgi:hypothetical protein